MENIISTHDTIFMPFDYCGESLSFQMNLNREFNHNLFTRMVEESAFILGCIETAQIILEETQPSTPTPQKKSLFQKIIGFLKHVYKLFVDKTQAILERDKEWLAENSSKLESIDYSGLQIEMIPFWSMGFGKVQSDSAKIQNKIITTLRNPKQVEKLKDMETVKKELFGEYLDENGDLTNGLKNYMRTGNAKGPLKPAILRDNQLKDMVTKEFRSFCASYANTVLPFVKRMLEDAQRQLTMIEKSLAAKMPTKENFYLIENAFHSETELSYIVNDVLLEAEQPPQDAKPTNSDKVDGKTKTSPTRVRVTDTGSKQRADEQEAMDNLSSDQLMFFKNVAQITHISSTALMTAMEERYNAYMNAMRQIISARAKGDKDTQDKKPGVADRVKNAVTRKK